LQTQQDNHHSICRFVYVRESVNCICCLFICYCSSVVIQFTFIWFSSVLFNYSVFDNTIIQCYFLLKKVKYRLVCFFCNSKNPVFLINLILCQSIFALSDLLGVFKEAYQMGAMLSSYSMFTFCPFFALQNFLVKNWLFNLGQL
jgi:hypothetical protein